MEISFLLTPRGSDGGYLNRPGIKWYPLFVFMYFVCRHHTLSLHFNPKIETQYPKFIFVFFWEYLSSILNVLLCSFARTHNAPLCYITKQDLLDISNIIFHNLVSTLNIVV